MWIVFFSEVTLFDYQCLNSIVADCSLSVTIFPAFFPYTFYELIVKNVNAEGGSLADPG